MQHLRILILSDGRPGHYHLSDGIAAAIGRRRRVEAVHFRVSRGRWPGGLAAALVNGAVGDERLIRLLSGQRLGDFPPADLIVSAGAETLPANILLARRRRVPNIFYGSLRSFRPEDFALVLTSYQRNAGRPRHALALKPSAADPDRVRTGVTGERAARVRTAGLLVGGNSGTFRYGADDWRRLLDGLEACHRTLGIAWHVSNSRRTDEGLSDELARLARQANGPIARFIDVRRSGAGTLAEIFAAADAMLVTDDSSSMISEAIWMRLPVVGVYPAVSSLPADEQDYRDWLAANGWCRSLALSDLTPPRLAAAIAALTPLKDNPLDALATLLADRLPAVVPRSA